MAELLIKLFKKKAKDEEDSRLKVGEACGICGIFLNLVLVIGKLILGILSASLSIIADAMNNLSDAGSSITTLVGFRLAGQKPDKEHPYGHGRMEYVAALSVSMIILVVGFEMGRESFEKIIHPTESHYTYAGLAVLGIAILVKGYMAYYNFREAGNIHSEALKAVGRDSLIDCIATTVIIICALIQMHMGYRLDGPAGLLIAAFILYQGVVAVKDSVDPLLGMKPDPAFVQAIKDITLSYDDKIVGVHDIMVHDYGPGRRIISLHAEVPSDGDVLGLHDVIDNLEKKLSNDLNCMTTIHMDPVAAHDPVTLALKEKLKEIISDYDGKLAFHDFRVVHGDTHTNLLFDLVIPFDEKMSEADIKDNIQAKVTERMGKEYFAVMEIDRE